MSRHKVLGPQVWGRGGPPIDRGVEASLGALHSSYKEDPVAVYATLLRQCGDARSILDGRKIHRHLAKHGYSSNSTLLHCLIQMYAKCGHLDDARAVFDSSPDKTEQSWSTIISAYSRSGRKKEALDIYRSFRGVDHSLSIPVSNSVLMSALAACSSPDDLAEGREIHRKLAKGMVPDLMLQTAIFSMYARCGSMDEARRMFDQMPDKDVVCYTVMISAYAQKGYHVEALELYDEMDSRGVEPNDKTFACVLSACAGIKDLERGKKVHRRIRKFVAHVDTVLQNALLNLYAKCDEIDEARRIFEEMERRTVATWNTMITACVQHDFFAEAREVFQRMDAPPNSITFTSVLGACCSPEDLETELARHHVREMRQHRGRRESVPRHPAEERLLLDRDDHGLRSARVLERVSRGMSGSGSDNLRWCSQCLQ